MADAPATNKSQKYGLDAELAAKREGKYDKNQEAQAREWIEAVVGKPMEGAFIESLRTGILLAELLNTIKPGCVGAYRSQHARYSACVATDPRPLLPFTALSKARDKDDGVHVH